MLTQQEMREDYSDACSRWFAITLRNADLFTDDGGEPTELQNAELAMAFDNVQTIEAIYERRFGRKPSIWFNL